MDGGVVGGEDVNGMLFLFCIDLQGSCGRVDCKGTLQEVVLSILNSWLILL